MRVLFRGQSLDITKPPDEKCTRETSSRWHCKAKRKRVLPVVFCVICFSFLIGWVLRDIFQYRSTVVLSSGANTTLDETAVEYDAEANVDGKSRVPGAEENPCELTSECKIVCRDADLAVLSEKINVTLKDQSCSHITLTIDSLHAVNNKLFRGWITLDSDINIQSLELRNSSISEIPPESFDAEFFRGTLALTLESLQVSHLQGNIFLGLLKLQELSLKNLPLDNIEPFVLAPIKFTLARLQVENCLNRMDPRAIMGETTLDHLAIAAFEFNMLEDVISDETFAMTPNLSSLYLRNSHITSLSKGMIDHLSKSVKQIHLDGNALSSVPQGVFDSFLERDVKVHLKDNPWNCDCELIYLRDIITSNKDMFDQIECASPPELAGQSIMSVDLCDTTTTTSETETTLSQTSETEMTSDGDSTVESTTLTTLPDSSTSVTTINSTYSPATTTPANNFQIQCLTMVVPLKSTIVTYEASRISLTKRSKIFTVFESQEGTVDVLFDRLYTNSVLLWFYDPSPTKTVFTVNIEDNAKCAEIYGRSMRISSLVPDKNYMFCVIYNSEIILSPFDCLPYKLLPTYDQRTWLVEDQKIIMISILISSIVVSVLTGIMVTYCFIRSFTTYQKACKRLACDSKADRSTTNHSYITPVVGYTRRQTLHKRSVSDTSIVSCRSYVSAVVPTTQFQYISWKKEIRPRTSMEYYPKEPPPPPLPPHPSKRLKTQRTEIKINRQESYDEPSYVSSPLPGRH